MVGMQSGTLEDNWAVSYKGKHSLVIQPSNRVPSYVHTQCENLCLHKMWAGIFIAALFIIAKKLETVKMSLKRWIDKQIVVHLYNGKLFSNKMKWAIKHEKT